MPQGTQFEVREVQLAFAPDGRALVFHAFNRSGGRLYLAEPRRFPAARHPGRGGGVDTVLLAGREVSGLPAPTGSREARAPVRTAGRGKPRRADRGGRLDEGRELGRGRHDTLLPWDRAGAVASVGPGRAGARGDEAGPGPPRDQSPLAVVPSRRSCRAVHHPRRVRPDRPERHRPPEPPDRSVGAHHRTRTCARYLPSGHIVYACNGALLAVRFDLRAFETVGDPVPVASGVQMDNEPGRETRRSRCRRRVRWRSPRKSPQPPRAPCCGSTARETRSPWRTSGAPMTETSTCHGTDRSLR